MSLNNDRKRRLICDCLKCNGAIVPETTAKNHQGKKKYEEACLKAITSTTTDSKTTI